MISDRVKQDSRQHQYRAAHPYAIGLLFPPVAGSHGCLSGKSEIVAQVKRGTLIIPTHESGPWYGVDMTNGSTACVHSEFLAQLR